MATRRRAQGTRLGIKMFFLASCAMCLEPVYSITITLNYLLWFY